MHFDSGQVISRTAREARELLPQLEAKADAFFLDGFAPAKNPEIWSPETVRELARLAAPGATLATWTVAGGVRSALQDAGFRVEKRDGFGHKREMLLGQWNVTAAKPAARDRRAVVVGAGIAGIACAERLGVRGWDITLVDARAERDGGAVGLLRPIANLRDATNARLSRSAFLYALQHYRALRDGYHLQWDRCGTLQLAADGDGCNATRRSRRSRGYPGDFLAFAGLERAARSHPWTGPDGGFLRARGCRCRASRSRTSHASERTCGWSAGGPWRGSNAKARTGGRSTRTDAWWPRRR